MEVLRAAAPLNGQALRPDYLFKSDVDAMHLQDYVLYYELYYIDLPHSATMYCILQIRSIMKANSST